MIEKYKNYLKLLLICIALFVLCFRENKAVKTDEFILEKSKFSNLKNWKNSEIGEFKTAYVRSCDRISAGYYEYIGDSFIKINRKDYLQHCNSIKELKDRELKKYIEKNFIPYLAKYNNNSNGIFTGYYEASINASYEKTDKYKYPIYGYPKDIVSLNLADFDENLPNKTIIGRVENNKLIQYYNRKEIDFDKKIDADVILWGDNLIDIFIMQVQGSAVANLPDGKTIRIGYAINNGHKFIGIGLIMKQKGLLEPGKSSMGDIKNWLENNPEKAAEIMSENPRYIFFRFNDKKGAIGAQGVPLVAKRSIAVDNKYIPMGTLIWLETKDASGNNLDRLVMAQDIGAAIKGGIRGDFFWGYGDDAFYNAGRMKSNGQYYILLPKG